MGERELDDREWRERFERFERLWEFVRSLFREDECFKQVGDYVVGLATVRPETAELILREHSSHNRQPSPWAVRRLAKDMARGLFLLNGDTVVFDARGELRNGRHRMTACVACGVPFRTFVVVGVDAAAFKTFDQHSKRTTAQVLQIEGETHCKVLSSAIGYLHGFLLLGRVSKPHANNLVTIDDDKILLGLHPGLRESVAVTAKSLPAQASRKVGGQGLAAAAHYVFSRHDRDLADLMFESLGSLTVPVGTQFDPVRRLIQLLMDNAAKGYQFGQDKLSGLLVKGWNAFAAGTSARGVVYKDDEPYPRVYGWEYGDDGLPVAAEGEV